MIGIPTAAPGSRLRQWWSRRPLRARITIAVGLVSLIVLLALSRLGVVFLYGAVLDAADAELRVQAVTVSVRIAGGTPASEVRNAQIRVVDNAGAPVDDGPALPLTPAELRRLAAGESVLSAAAGAADLGGGARGGPRRVDPPGGGDRGPGGCGDAARPGGDRVGVGAVLASVVVALAAWIATRAALRPVDRMRLAAAALPPGERLPVPTARDELRGLAEEINRLLARRDDAVVRLERFTGDAAHELRSPVAAIRAQAEVAVAHPDPELTSETLRAVVDESARLTSMLSDLLALTRADSGQRPPAVAVDLVAAAGAAIARFPDSTDHPVLQLAAPTPAQVRPRRPRSRWCWTT